jgi:uncharacterized protein (DUF2384 family)
MNAQTLEVRAEAAHGGVHHKHVTARGALRVVDVHFELLQRPHTPTRNIEYKKVPALVFPSRNVPNNLRFSSWFIWDRYSQFVLNEICWGSMQQRIRTSDPSLAESGFRAFENVADRWRLTTKEREAVLGLSRSTYARLRAEPAKARLDGNALERLSHILGIYKALHILFADAGRADTWLDRPSADFAGQPARKRLTSGLVADLAFVRHYLDVARG